MRTKHGRQQQAKGAMGMGMGGETEMEREEREADLAVGGTLRIGVALRGIGDEI